MKYIRRCISIVLLMSAVSTSWATGLSLNKSRFLPGDTLAVTLDQNWSDQADVYIAVSLPADETLYFLTSSGFVADLTPYAQGQGANGSKEVFRIDLPNGLPNGKYTFYAAATQPGTVEIIGEIVQSSLSYFAPNGERLPGEVTGHRYARK